MHRVKRLSHVVRVHTPLSHILLLEEFLLFASKVYFLRVESVFGLFAQPLSFFEGLSLLTLVLKPSAELLVDELARLQSEVAISNHQVAQPTVDVDNLRDLSDLEHLGEVVDLGANGVVLVGQVVRFHL